MSSTGTKLKRGSRERRSDLNIRWRNLVVVLEGPMKDLQEKKPDKHSNLAHMNPLYSGR